MIAIEVKDLQVGKKYYIHQVKDKDTHAPISRKYKAVCAISTMYGGWCFFVFDSVKGINTADINLGLSITVEENCWGLYKFYLCESDEIVERVMTNAVLQKIIGDTYFKFY